MDTNKSIARAAEALAQGSLGEAEKECRSILTLFPRHFHALNLLGEALTRAGKDTEARTAYERAEMSRPGPTPRFTQLAMEQFRTAYGAPIPARAEKVRDGCRVQMRSLGQNGRYGNQLLQYGFVRLYAQQHDLIAEFPDWIGRDIFDLDDPFPSTNLPTVNETNVDLVGSLRGCTGQVFADRNLEGFFSGNTKQISAWKSEFGGYFTPGKTVHGLLDEALDNLRSLGKTLVAIHLRYGDFGYGRFWVAPPSWYLSWLKTIWGGLQRPVLYIASDGAGSHADFADFNPRSARHLGVEIPGLDFLIDHHILRHADHLAIANSSFSFTAAMLNTSAKSFMRPEPNLRTLVTFDPWASDVLWDATIESQSIAPPEQQWIRNELLPTQNVAYWGSFCSTWTNFARSAVSHLKINEAENQTSLLEIFRTKNIRRLRLLVLENADIQREFIDAAADISHQARVDMVLLRPTAMPLPNSVLRNLSAMNYGVFRFHEKGLIPVTEDSPSVGESWLAIHSDLRHKSSERMA